MKNSTKKGTLRLDPKIITSLNQDEMTHLKGGFTSITIKCSIRMRCNRLWTQNWGDSNGDLPGGECEYYDTLNV